MGLIFNMGGGENTNKSIIIRAINKTYDPDFPRHIIIEEPEDLLSLLGRLFMAVREILNGKYDNYTTCSYERFHLEDFKRRYKVFESINITDIGFEDYYLIYDLVCNKNNIGNPHRYYIREALKVFFIYSIFNSGKVNKNHENFPLELKTFFNLFDNLFTTNYDQNIEVFTNRKVNYLHGSFNVRKEIYNKESFRNKLSDSPIKDFNIDERYYYLYSNVLTTYSGYLKKSNINEARNANQAFEKMVVAYSTNEEIKETVDKWATHDSHMLRNIAEGVKLKKENKDLNFKESYPIKEFEDIKGEIEIVGFSPNNDTHIFQGINDNLKLKSIKYYYFAKEEVQDVQKLLSNHEVIFEDVSLLWEKYK